MVEWVPPAMKADDFAKLTAIEPGIPEYMRPQLVNWVLDVLDGPYEDFSVGVNFLSLQVKENLPPNRTYFRHWLDKASSEALVNLIDCMLFYDVAGVKEEATSLGYVLEAGRSEWQVSTVDGEPRLSHRIPTGVLQSYEEVASKTGMAGELLAEAFNAAYGVNPNPNHAYDLSVKAVETLACPRYLPKNTKATLGSVITHLSSKSVTLPLREKNANHQELVKQMMQNLWEGGERHGSEHYSGISEEGAKTAQALAFALVALLHEQVIAVS
ncbi:hypothetical protein [Arthrobacter sp. Leaf234]|uniref:hypothetical protein n=1 Tax=Arthrobacter sp. Leaf234 TaxID=1736303 RepID=UPI000A79AF23|nr:hypothetical protein [Arthrobacter sp. Leaf234]